jgi:class 3 adenylate cyclase
VLKPLWQRWYAILSYVLAAVGVILLIIKARERSLKETQRELEEKVQERTADLAREKELTERLLLNILPKETADELQKRGKATARHYNQVTVLFTDFKGFTRFAESTRPEDLVQELDRCFIAFDDIIEKYSLEKIKTIGDAYMCAGGVPIRNTNNAVVIVLAALEIRDFMLRLQQEKQQRNERFWEIRLGINTGPLTAGVVGKKKFAYDIWGDTVNTASRMESCSEPGKVNISASTYELVKDYFDCTYRGKFDAKGKGEVDMYFVNGIRKDFSENGDGVSPNTALLQVVA